MIRKATLGDKEKIYLMWKEIFADNDTGYTDYYFENVFNCDNTYLIEIDGKIITTLQRNRHILMLNGKKINVSMILGVATIETQRNKGYMSQLMEYALKEAEHEEMITLIQSYDKDLYKPFGFEYVYYRKRTSYSHTQIPKFDNLKVNENYTADDLLELYNHFSSRFNGYYVRDKAYYVNYLKEIKAEGGNIAVYRDENYKIQGYMVYYLSPLHCDIKEIIYSNSWAFIGLLSYGANMRVKVSVHTSNCEQVLKMIPGGESVEYPFTMARVNDIALCNILFNFMSQNVVDVFNDSGIPLFMHEYA